MIWTIAIIAVALTGSNPLQAETLSPAAKHIQSYYQQLMPTIQQAGRLSVRERDKRFEPAITSAFDLATMTRLAVGPKWATFSPDQQAAVRDAFAHFIIADYASQVSDYSGESFVVDPGDARWRRDRQVEAAAARRPDGDDQLSRPRRAGDRCLFQWDGE
jgi:phospholipid transport system substrate-binding protein